MSNRFATARLEEIQNERIEIEKEKAKLVERELELLHESRKLYKKMNS